MNSQDIIRETYDSALKAQKTSLISSATIHAVVNTGAVGDPKTFIGLVTSVVASSPTIYAVVNTGASSGNVTLDQGSKTQIVGNLTLSDPKGYIGLVTATGNVTLNASKNWIGLASISGNVGFAGNVTLDSGSKTQIVGNITLSDPKSYIGLVSVSGNVGFAGNITLDAGSKTQIIGNITLSNSKNYIGLTTSTIGNQTLYAVVNTGASNSNITLNPSDAYIGLVSVSGNVGIKGNLTLSDSKGFIGLTTVIVGTDYASSSIIQGMVSGASGAVKQFASNSVNWCIAKAHPGNPTTIYVGPSLASVNVSFPLDPGEAVGYSISNTNLLFMCAVGTSELRFTGGL